MNDNNKNPKYCQPWNPYASYTYTNNPNNLYRGNYRKHLCSSVM